MTFRLLSQFIIYMHAKAFSIPILNQQYVPGCLTIIWSICLMKLPHGVFSFQGKYSDRQRGYLGKR